MRQVFEVLGRLAGLNEYTNACRTNRYAGAKLKRENQDRVAWAVRAARLRPFEGPVEVHITFVEPSMRRDPDNIRHGAKYILDALVETGVIKDDSQRYVKGIADRYLVNPSNPRVIVELEEA